jgi:hypothetical protein
MQRGPQLARRRGMAFSTVLASKMAHHRKDAVDADLCVRDFALPQPPTQSFGFVGNGRLCLLLPRIGRQYGVSNLFQMVQSHNNVEPIEHRGGCASGVGKNVPWPGTAIGGGIASEINRKINDAGH